MPEASGCITSRLRSPLCIWRIISRRCLRFISSHLPGVALSLVVLLVFWLFWFLFALWPFMLTFSGCIQPGPARAAKLIQSLHRGLGLDPYSGQSRHHLFNRHYRSHANVRAETLQRNCGLSCRAGCAQDSSAVPPFKSRGTLETLKEFLAHTTTPKGWPALMSVDNRFLFFLTSLCPGTTIRPNRLSEEQFSPP